MWSKSKVLNLLKKCYIYILSSPVTNHHWKHLATSLLGFEKLLTPKWMVMDAFVRSWHFAFIFIWIALQGLTQGTLPSEQPKILLSDCPIPRNLAQLWFVSSRNHLDEQPTISCPINHDLSIASPTCGTQTTYFLSEKHHSLLRNGERLKEPCNHMCFVFVFNHGPW